MAMAPGLRPGPPRAGIGPALGSPHLRPRSMPARNSEVILYESSAPDTSRIYSVLPCRGYITCVEKDIRGFGDVMG